MSKAKTERNQEIVRLWEAGWKMADIAAEFGIQTPRVSTIISKAGPLTRTPRRGRPMVYSSIAELLVGKKPGESYAEFAKRTGTTKGAVIGKVWRASQKALHEASGVPGPVDRRTAERVATRQKWLRIAQEAPDA